MPRESSDSIYLGPTKRGLTDILHLQSVSRSSTKSCFEVLWLFATQACSRSQKQSLDFHLMPGLINQFKKSNCTQETFVSSGTTENSGLKWENSCLDTCYLECGMARPRVRNSQSIRADISSS